MINKFIVIYYLFLFCSFAMGLLGAAVGLHTIVRWRSATSPETKRKFENNLYLCMSAIFLGACIRVVMVPLWFSMLQSLIPLIPGSMCLAGVHLAVPIYYSWLSSLLKLVLPLFYFTWIALTIIDRKIIEQPFLKFRHFFLIPLLIFIFAETFLDLKYLFLLQPKMVTCCTAIFDLSSRAEIQWHFVISFCVVLAMQLIFMTLFQKKKTTYMLTVISSVIVFINLPLALHTKLSPLILDAPFHHCIFCLLQINMFALAGTFFLILAIYSSFSFGLIGLVGRSKSCYEKIDGFLNKIKLASLILYAIGFVLLLIPTIYSLIKY